MQHFCMDSFLVNLTKGKRGLDRFISKRWDQSISICRDATPAFHGFLLVLEHQYLLSHCLRIDMELAFILEYNCR